MPDRRIYLFGRGQTVAGYRAELRAAGFEVLHAELREPAALVCRRP